MKRKRILGIVIFILSVLLWGVVWMLVYSCNIHQEIKGYVFIFGSIITYCGLNYSYNLIFKDFYNGTRN